MRPLFAILVLIASCHAPPKRAPLIREPLPATSVPARSPRLLTAAIRHVVSVDFGSHTCAIQIREAATLQITATAPTRCDVRLLSLSPNEDELAVAADTIEILDVRTGARRRELDVRALDMVWGRAGILLVDPVSVRLVDAGTAATLATFERDGRIVLGPDGTHFLSISSAPLHVVHRGTCFIGRDETYKRVEVATGRRALLPVREAYGVVAMADRGVVAIRTQRWLYVFDLRTPRRLPLVVSCDDNRAVLSRAGDRLAIIGDTICLYDTTDGRLLVEDDRTPEPGSVVFGADGLRLFISDSQRITVWELPAVVR